jgi:hypothetical protein
MLCFYTYGIKDVLQMKRWRCPRCVGICNCAVCLRLKGIDPYEYEIHHDDTYQFEDIAIEFGDGTKELLLITHLLEHKRTLGRTDKLPKTGAGWNSAYKKKKFKLKPKLVLPEIEELR